jgi:hypothetical protein
MVPKKEGSEGAMHFDFSEVEDVETFISVPEGEHLCRVAEVREGMARDESPRWSLRLEVAAGDCAGRTAGWDSITWSSRGVNRVKHVLEALGFSASGQLEIQSEELLGRQARVLFQEEEWEDPASGRRQRRLGVPFIGYQAAE